MKHFSFKNNIYTKFIVGFAIITALIMVSIASIVFLLPYYNELQNQQQNQHRNQKLKNVETKVDNRSDQLYYSKLKLAISILNALNEEKPNENIYYSPSSVFRVLLLSYFGAAGETEKELKHVLGLDWAKNKQDVENWYKLETDLREKRYQNQSFEYFSAEKFYITDHTKIR